MYLVRSLFDFRLNVLRHILFLMYELLGLSTHYEFLKPRGLCIKFKFWETALKQ
jgi:hypothetical protein